MGNTIPYRIAAFNFIIITTSLIMAMVDTRLEVVKYRNYKVDTFPFNFINVYFYF